MKTTSLILLKLGGSMVYGPRKNSFLLQLIALWMLSEDIISLNM